MHFGRRHVHIWKNKYLCAVVGLTSLGLLLFLSGCAMVGPNYSPVQPDSPQGWTAAMEKGLEATRPQNGTLAKWWEVFDDPVLCKLEKQAVEGNLDLKIALSRLRQARLNRGISKSGLLPSMSADSRVQRQRGSESMPSMSGGEEHDYYLGQFDSAWELDLFGGIQRSVQAAQAELEASRAGVNEVLISLMAEVALNYTEVRTYQRRLQITRSNITNQQKAYDLNKSRYESGLIDELAVQQSLRNLERTRAQISSLQTGLQAAKNRLAVLMGLTPGALESELSQAKAIPDIPSQVAVGIPAEAMRRRPDIQRAERQLAAQTARIGAATAELYPKFHLLGTIGLEALDSGSDFLSPESRFWNIGPGISWNIFNGQALRLNIDLQTEKQKQALLEYTSTVLRAQEEIEDALTAYAKEQMRAESLKRAVSAAKRTEFLARDRYKAGLVDFYNVLDAQRSLLELEDEYIQSLGQVTSNLARLYKALGGGWAYQGEVAEKAGNMKDISIEKGHIRR
ncbi:MAG: efflux transporter outer membrane subunit [Desulfovermiculus sp.]